MRTLSRHECKQVSGGYTRDQLVADLKTQESIISTQYLSSQRDNIMADDTSPATLITPVITDTVLNALGLPTDPSTNSDALAAAIQQAQIDNGLISIMDQYGITDTSQHDIHLNTDVSQIDMASLRMSDFDIWLLITPTEVVTVYGPEPITAGELEKALNDSNADVDLENGCQNYDDINVDDGSDFGAADGSSYGNDNDDDDTGDDFWDAGWFDGDCGATF